MGFILFVHVLVCVLLVISILMQAGRGGGLAESFASAESMFGTQTNAFMVRVSTVLAAIFIITSLFLAFSASKKSNSLMADKKLLPKVEQTKAEAPAETIKIEPMKVEQPKAEPSKQPAAAAAVPANAPKP